MQPKSPESVMKDIYEYALTNEHNWSCAAYSEGQWCCLNEEHTESHVLDKLIRSSLSSVLCWAAEMMPTDSGLDAPSNIQSWELGVDDCKTILINEAKKISNE